MNFICGSIYSKNGATASKNHPYRLVLDAEVLKELFEFSTMEASSDLFDDCILCKKTTSISFLDDPSGPPTRTIRVQVETVVLILFPLGSGMTQFLLNWLPEDNQSKYKFDFVIIPFSSSPTDCDCLNSDRGCLRPSLEVLRSPYFRAGMSA